VVVELEHFDEAALKTLVGSMRQRGALNPVEQAAPATR
jgi:hypothetical protein